MTDSNSGTAQNKLGELFVDLGAKGGKNLIQELSNVKLGFLGATKAAADFTKPLIQAGKESINSAVGIAQGAAALATSYKEYQKILRYLKDHSISEGVISEIANARETIYNSKRGGGLPGNFALGLNLIGKSIENYNGSYESIVQLLEDFEAASKEKKWSKEERLRNLNLFGFSSEIAYAYDRGFNLRDASTIPDEYIENQIQLEENINSLKNTFEQMRNSFIGEKIAPSANTIVKETTDIINNPQKKINEIINSNDAIINTAKFLEKIGDKAWNSFTPKNKDSLTGLAAPIDFSSLKPQELYNGSSINVTPEIMEGATIPPGITSSNNYTININNENNINAQNAQEIASKITDINTQSLQLSQFQIHNLAGR